MHADLESGTARAQHALYDPSIAWNVDDDKALEVAVRAGSLLAMHTVTDGSLDYRVYVDEELPETLRPRIITTTTTKDVLLRVPSGKLVASGIEHVRGPEAASIELRPGNYLVDVYELDYDWDRDIAPVLSDELGGAYRREVIVTPLTSALLLVGIGAGIGGLIAWNLTIAIGGAAALALGFGTSRLISSADYEAKKTAIAKRFPGLVLVLRRLDDGADLTAYEGKQLSFTD